MDKEMIERVADAITERRTGRAYSSIELAIAAIKAMREPTEHMKMNANYAIDDFISFDEADIIYKAYIDTVLNDE